MFNCVVKTSVQLEISLNISVFKSQLMGLGSLKKILCSCKRKRNRRYWRRRYEYIM